MSLPLDGYRTTKLLRTSSTTRVYAAVREADQQKVVAKLYELADDSSLEARVEHEFRLIHGLEVEGVVRALALERAGTQLAVILEWCEGVNLEEFAGGRALPLDTFLSIALQIARALADVHAQRVIHRDIKPTNILIDPETLKVSIADFGISVLLQSERERINDPSVVEGTLPYIAPEQTGRTHREVDFRSDLYSLGVTFYEMLVGRRPFEGRTPLELIHAHLARRPESPQWLRAELPTPLSAMVMKLLEKAPERRYQSARGLRNDLQRLQEALASGRGLDDFELGVDDVPMTLQLPHRLYGRSVEVELLVREYRKVAEREPRFVLLTGPAGMGKTALVAELEEPILGRQGFLARGKFARERGEKPYSGFTLAFTDLVDQLLTESDDQLEHWRREIVDALGGLVEVMCELVPKLRMVLEQPDRASRDPTSDVDASAAEAGPEPASTRAASVARDLGPAESHTRTALACARLVQIFARPEHPLALALDDVHFADRASCELLSALLSEPESALLVIATMRMDELALGHPLRDVIDEVEGEREQMLWLDLGPLGRREVAALIGDALARPPDDVSSLAGLVGRKTNYNPFFIRQFLTHLVDLELLRATAEGWVWDEQAIEHAGIPDDLLGMMTEKLERLEDGPREVLTVGAVIGSRFDVPTIELTAEPQNLARALVRLVEEGLLTASGPTEYAFTHDRIREVAYQMVPLARRCALHRKIGEFRRSRADLSQLSEIVYELVDHLDLGYGLIALPDETPEAAAARVDESLVDLDRSAAINLAELNSLAGYKALNGAAPTTAVNYLQAGVTLLERTGEFPEPGEPGYVLRLSLELGLCQALALSGKRERAELYFGRLLQRPVEPGDYGRIVSKRIEALILASDRRAGLRAGLAGLEALGYPIAVDRGRFEAGAATLRLLSRLRPGELRNLVHRAEAHDPRAKAAMAIMMMLGSVAPYVDRAVHLALVATHVHLLLTHGRHSSGPVALSQLATLVAVASRELGLEVLEIANELAELESAASMRHRLDISRWLVASWRYAYGESLAPLRDAGTRAQEAGDLEFAGYALSLLAPLQFAAGVHLRALERAVEVAVHRIMQWDMRSLEPGIAAFLDFARLMLSGDEELLALPDPLQLEAIELDEEFVDARLTVTLLQAQLFYLFGRYREAWESLQPHEREFESGFAGAWRTGGFREVRGLLAAARYARAGRIERTRLMLTLERDHRFLRRQARQGNVNFEAAALLLEAEIVAIRGPIDRAFELFGRARRKASTQRALMTEAIALERMAVHARGRGLDELSMGPLREAKARYHYWGAFTKVAALERRWPELRDDPMSVRAPSDSTAEMPPERTSTGKFESSERTGTQDGRTITGGRSSSTSGHALDMTTILKTTQAISSELRLEDVVGRVMSFGLENAGADRGALILNRDGVSGVAAVCSAEQPLQSFLREPIPLEQAAGRVPVSLLKFVERTREPAIFDDITTDLRFVSDPYIDHQRARSVLCLPIMKQTHFVGLLYLENKLSPGCFTEQRLEVLRLLVTLAAGALENAQLYEKLRAGEVRWRSLVEGLPDVVMLVDLEGRIQFINHADARAREQHVGKLAGEFIDPEDLPALRATMRSVIRDAEMRELEVVGRFHGDSRWYNARLAPIVVDGRVERVICVGTDISERKQAEAAHAQLEATIRQQQRLESIGTLASGVAHEINNPVQGIMNYAELIATSTDATELIREFAEEIGHESDRVATIVRNLLAFSRQEGDRAAAPARLSNIVEGTMSLIRTVLRKDQIAVNIDIPEDLPKVDCRVQQIQQVIMNLVTNARDALVTRWPEYHEDKRIDISGSTFEREGKVWLRLSVCDRGGGIPEDVVASIFDPFFTTKGRDQGTGLGLAVSHGIMADHGGKLSLDNVPGESACFNLELPARVEVEVEGVLYDVEASGE